jgi:very-short-patch-repair endonuclease
MFSQKTMDFVAQSRRDGSIVAIIELDDRTHDMEKDSKRDTILATAGYRIVRWNSKTKPDAAAIRARLAPEESPDGATSGGAAARSRPRTK